MYRKKAIRVITAKEKLIFMLMGTKKLLLGEHKMHRDRGGGGGPKAYSFENRKKIMQL
jgi:hypothetical protein